MEHHVLGRGQKLVLHKIKMLSLSSEITFPPRSRIVYWSIILLIALLKSGMAASSLSDFSMMFDFSITCSLMMASFIGETLIQFSEVVPNIREPPLQS